MAPERTKNFQETVQEFTSEMKELDKKYSKETKDKLDELKKEIIEGPRKRVLEIRDMIKNLEEEIKKAPKNQKDALEGELKKMQEAYRTMNALMADLRDGDIDSPSAILEVETDPKEQVDPPVKPDVPEGDPKMAEEMRKLRERLEALEREMAERNEELNEKDRLIEQMKKDMEDMKADDTEKIEELKKSLEEKRKEIEKDQNKLQAKEKDLKQREEKLAKDKETLDERMKKIEGDDEKAKKQREAVQADIKKLAEERGELEMDRKNYEMEKEMLDMKEAMLEEKKQELEDKEAELKELEVALRKREEAIGKIERPDKPIEVPEAGMFTPVFDEKSKLDSQLKSHKDASRINTVMMHMYRFPKKDKMEIWDRLVRYKLDVHLQRFIDQSKERIVSHEKRIKTEEDPKEKKRLEDELKDFQSTLKRQLSEQKKVREFYVGTKEKPGGVRTTIEKSKEMSYEDFMKEMSAVQKRVTQELKIDSISSSYKFGKSRRQLFETILQELDGDFLLASFGVEFYGAEASQAPHRLKANLEKFGPQMLTLAPSLADKEIFGGIFQLTSYVLPGDVFPRTNTDIDTMKKYIRNPKTLNINELRHDRALNLEDQMNGHYLGYTYKMILLVKLISEYQATKVMKLLTSNDPRKLHIAAIVGLAHNNPSAAVKALKGFADSNFENAPNNYIPNVPKYRIARDYLTRFQKLYGAPEIKNTLYTIQPGDSLSKIALIQFSGTDVGKLQIQKNVPSGRWENVSSWTEEQRNLIEAGWRVRLSGGEAMPETEKIPDKDKIAAILKKSKEKITTSEKGMLLKVAGELAKKRSEFLTQKKDHPEYDTAFAIANHLKVLERSTQMTTPNFVNLMAMLRDILGNKITTPEEAREAREKYEKNGIMLISTYSNRSTLDLSNSDKAPNLRDVKSIINNTKFFIKDGEYKIEKTDYDFIEGGDVEESERTSLIGLEKTVQKKFLELVEAFRKQDKKKGPHIIYTNGVAENLGHGIGLTPRSPAHINGRKLDFPKGFGANDMLINFIRSHSSWKQDKESNYLKGSFAINGISGVLIYGGPNHATHYDLQIDIKDAPVKKEKEETNKDE